MKNSGLTLLAFLAVAVTAGALWLTKSAVISKDATWENVVADAQQGGYRLITTQDLWKRYREHRDNLLLVDTRQEWEYRLGHIQGAVNFPMEPTWMARWQKKRALDKLLGAAPERTIVFY